MTDEKKTGRFGKGADPRRNVGGAPKGPRQGISATEYKKRLMKQAVPTLEKLQNVRDDPKAKHADVIKASQIILSEISKMVTKELELSQPKEQPKETPKETPKQGNVVGFSNRPIKK